MRASGDVVIAGEPEEPDDRVIITAINMGLILVNSCWFELSSEEEGSRRRLSEICRRNLRNVAS